jgi:hypothetical protein
MNPLLRLACVILIACFAGVATWAYFTTDWAAYREAAPPEDRGKIDTGIAELKSFSIGGIDAFEKPLAFSWSEYQSVELSAQGRPGTLRISKHGLSIEELKRYNQETAHLCRPSVLLYIVRKSSLNERGVVVGMMIIPSFVGPEEVIRGKGKIWIPHVPGRYLLKVNLLCKRGPREAGFQDEESTIGVFELEVLPNAVG